LASKAESAAHPLIFIYGPEIMEEGRLGRVPTDEVLDVGLVAGGGFVEVGNEVVGEKVALVQVLRPHVLLLVSLVRTRIRDNRNIQVVFGEMVELFEPVERLLGGRKLDRLVVLAGGRAAARGEQFWLLRFAQQRHLVGVVGVVGEEVLVQGGVQHLPNFLLGLPHLRQVRPQLLLKHALHL